MQRLRILHSLVLVCSTALIFGLASLAYAQVSRPGCDPEFMDAIEAKAWLHGQRRITQNQNLITKPDSVLEYSCFNQFIGYVAFNPDGRRFSENDPTLATWGSVSAVHEYSLDLALFYTVTQPLIDYLRENFSHTYLAGRLEPAGGAPPGYGEYNCDAMAHVWREARCMNFMDEDVAALGALDGFYEFAFYGGNDPRLLPREYPACTPDTTRITAAFTETYAADGNRDGADDAEQALFRLDPDNDPAFTDRDDTDNTPYLEDPILVTEILNILFPADCENAAAIPTGVHVEIRGDKTLEEHFCSRPGCSYDGGACILD